MQVSSMLAGLGGSDLRGEPRGIDGTEKASLDTVSPRSRRPWSRLKTSTAPPSFLTALLIERIIQARITLLPGNVRAQSRSYRWPRRITNYHGLEKAEIVSTRPDDYFSHFGYGSALMSAAILRRSGISAPRSDSGSIIQQRSAILAKH